jgi:hypothetical protein
MSSVPVAGTVPRQLEEGWIGGGAVGGQQRNKID